MITDNGLNYQLFKIEAISKDVKLEMYLLMQNNYRHVTQGMFEYDLSSKHFIGLITDENGKLIGFTTYVIDPKGCAGHQYHVIFSGDTIIAPEHWGTQIMMKGWCHTIGQLVATDHSKPWYWYLMSKGHRTYMYLPLFFKSYYPSILEGEHSSKYREIADQVSTYLYPNDWNKDTGIIIFKEHHGTLNSDLAEGTYRKIKSPHVHFFLEKNPGFYKGDELVCIAHLNPDNMIRTAKEYFLKGLKEPIA